MLKVYKRQRFDKDLMRLETRYEKSIRGGYPVRNDGIFIMDCLCVLQNRHGEIRRGKMEEYHQITLDEWTTWKEEIRQKLAETAQNFVYIGYRLKQIRDSGMYGGAADIFEFAQNEYGLGKSTVSRFIAINEKYSKEGNSLELKDEYKGFSSSKLSEMLTLPDSECELITEKTTIKDIRELKNFDRQQVSENTAKTEGDSPLRIVIIDYFKDKRDDLNDILRLIYDGMVRDAAELMNPSGIGTHSKGICFLFMYEYDKGIKYKLLTEQQPRSMDWPDFLHEVFAVYEAIWEGGERDVWSMYYGGEAVATSQQTKEKSEVVTTETEETPSAAGIEENENLQSQEPQQPEEMPENENPENKPSSEEAESAKAENDTVEDDSEKTENEEEPENAKENELEIPESQEMTQAEAVATSQQKKDDGEHSDDRFIRRDQMIERLEKLQKAINLQDWEYALDINKHLGWDIEWMLNN